MRIVTESIITRNMPDECDGSTGVYETPRIGSNPISGTSWPTLKAPAGCRTKRLEVSSPVEVIPLKGKGIGSPPERWGETTCFGQLI